MAAADRLSFANEIEGVALKAASLEVTDRKMSGDRWIETIRQLKPVVSGSPWWIGDLLAFGQRKYGDGTYKAAAKALDCSVGGLYNAVWTSKNVRPAVREPDVPWGAHYVVAALDESEQRRWLKLAREEKLPATELRRRIRAATEAGFPTGQNGGLDAAAHWAAAGMPEYDPLAEPYRLVVSFETEADRDEFLAKIGSPTIHNRNGRAWSTWWPDRPKDDVKAVEFA